MVHQYPTWPIWEDCMVNSRIWPEFCLKLPVYGAAGWGSGTRRANLCVHGGLILRPHAQVLSLPLFGFQLRPFVFQQMTCNRVQPATTLLADPGLQSCHHQTADHPKKQLIHQPRSQQMLLLWPELAAHS